MEQNVSMEDDVFCGYYEGYTTQRFVIITVASLVSVFGVAANTLLLLVFLKTLPSSIYLLSLSVLDLLICLTYILLFGVDAGFVYLKLETLFFLYHRYILIVFFVAKCVQFAIPFVLIMITLERYLWTTKEKTRVYFSPVFNDRGRSIATVLLFLICFIMRLPVFFATKVEQYPNCPDYFRSESVSQEEWVSHSNAYYVYDFHVVTAVQMCFPFLVLLILNAIIVKRLLAEKKETTYTTIQPRLSTFVAKAANESGTPTMPENYVLLEVATKVMKESLIQRSSRGKRSQLRNAIFTMLAIVTSYLLCNSIHLFLTILERFDSSVLYDSEDPNQSSNFYIALSDTVSIFYMATSAIRILIYCKCNPKLRGEIRQYLSSSKTIESS